MNKAECERASPWNNNRMKQRKVAHLNLPESPQLKLLKNCQFPLYICTDPNNNPFVMFAIARQRWITVLGFHLSTNL